MHALTRWMKPALAVVLLVIVLGGGWFYRAQEQAIRKAIETDLFTVLSLKVAEVAAWRERQLEYAAVLEDDSFAIQSVVRFLADPREENGAELLAYLRGIAQHLKCDDVLLEDSERRIWLSLKGQSGKRGGEAAAFSAALRDRKPVLTEIYTGLQDPAPHISVVAPLFTGDGQAPGPAGALILIQDASRQLFPLIQSWPTSTKTAETLLVRRDGDEVLFLSGLRHQPDAALKLRIPLSQTDVPAVMAVNGRQGVFEGYDYRGIKVVSVIAPVPGSPWFMVAKIDSAEVFSEWHARALLILTVLAGIVMLAVVLVFAALQQHKKHHYRELYRTEAALRAEAERHSIVLKSIGDAVIVTDSLGRVELLNAVAEDLTGWRDEDARGKPLEEVFRIVNEQTLEKVEDPAARVLREGLVVGLADHTLLIARDGTKRPVADSGAPFHDVDGKIDGVVLVFRDQSSERKAQRLAQVRMELIEYGAAHTMDDLLRKALDEIDAFVDSPIGFCYFPDSDQQTLSLQQWSTRTLEEFCRAGGKGPHCIIDRDSVWLECVRERKPVIHNDYGSVENRKDVPEGYAGVVRELAVPVMREGRVVAVLGVGDKPVDYKDEDAQTVAYIADVTWEVVETQACRRSQAGEPGATRSGCAVRGHGNMALGYRPGPTPL